jgi:rhodanese-related sulfurtransferase
MKRSILSLLGVVLTAIMLAASACAPAPASAPSVESAAGVPAQIEAIAPATYQSQFVESSQAHLLVDVRTPEEFASGHIPGAVNIPLQELEGRLAEVPTDSPVVVYCRSGNRSAQAADLLQEAGYTQIYDLGGIAAWQAQGLPVQ